MMLAAEKNQAAIERNDAKSMSARSQALLSSGREALMDGINREAGAAAIGNATPAAVAKAKEAANDQYGKALGQAMQIQEQKEEAADTRYANARSQVNMARYNNEMDKANQASLAASEGIKAGLNLATEDIQRHLDNGKGMFEGLFKKKNIVEPKYTDITKKPKFSSGRIADR